MYISIALILCSWILIYSTGQMKVDRVFTDRASLGKERLELQKLAARERQKEYFDISRKLAQTQSSQEEKALDSESPKAKEKKVDLQNIGKKQKSEPKERNLHRISFYDLVQSKEPSRLKEAFLRLWEEVLLETIPMPTEEKKRFAIEVLRALRGVEKSPDGIIDESLERLRFDRHEDRVTFCIALRSNPSPLDFITLKKCKIPFFNLDVQSLQVLFPDVTKSDLEKLLEMESTNRSYDVCRALERLLGEPIIGSHDPLLKNLSFAKVRKRDKKRYHSTSKDSGPRVWRIY